jgi:hypothetical protein
MSTYFEYKPDPPEAFAVRSVIAGCVENGADALLFDRDALAPAFFDLSSGVAGELLHQLSIYRIRMAAVVPDPAQHSQRFQEFMREANQGRQYRFFPDREAAIAWLEDRR